MRILTRIRDSKTLLNCVTWLIAAYVKLAHRTTTWTKLGFEERDTALKTSPVIILCWHERLVYAPLSWDHTGGPVCTLRSASRAGVVSAGVQERMGMIPVRMHDEDSNLASSRKIAKLMNAGTSLGVTGDGPEGPARVLNMAALEWARLTGKPIFLFAYATKAHRRWNTWDHMIAPRPFTKGVMAYRKWDGTVPRRPAPGEMEALRNRLEADLSAFTQDTDDAVAAL